jgi:hypothetical protein
MPGAMPPQEGGSLMPDMGMEPGFENEPMGDGMGQDMGDQFDADFDAGVEANEETDPKRFIQQLTGKLSQSLRKYNEGLPQPDADLNKYVAGMVVKQCIEGLSQEDVNDILKKIDNDETEETEEMSDMQQEEPMEPMQGNEMPQEPMNESESVRQSVSNRYSNLVDDETSDNKPVKDRRTYHKRPFTGKTFKA